MISYGGSGLLAHGIALGLLLHGGLRPGDEVTKVIYDIVASNEVDLPNAPVPIVFQSSTGDEVTVHLRK